MLSKKMDCANLNVGRFVETSFRDSMATSRAIQLRENDFDIRAA